jgi:transposase
MCVKHCKLSRNKQLELLRYFVAGSTARTAAELAGKCSSSLSDLR